MAVRAAVDLTPEMIIAQSLQSGFEAPNGLTTQSPQNSQPQRLQMAVADSKLWIRHLPVNWRFNFDSLLVPPQCRLRAFVP